MIIRSLYKNTVIICIKKTDSTCIGVYLSIRLRLIIRIKKKLKIFFSMEIPDIGWLQVNEPDFTLFHRSLQNQEK
jgi:hypothetical protein